MTDLLQTPLATQPAPSRSQTLPHRTSSPDPTTLSQTVLRWQTALFPPTISPQSGSADRLITLHRLVRRIAQVRASFAAETILNSTEPCISPVLLEQVRPEAQDVLTHLSEIEQISDRFTTVLSLRSKSAQSLQTLIPWLLWNLVQTTHEAVQLIEGCAGQMRQGETWQSGTLRLVAGLKLTHASTTYAFDLVTQQALPQLLAPETQICLAEDISESVLLQSASSVASTLQRLITQLKTHPVLQHYWTGFAADWLIPHHGWQSGIAVLELGFEFMSTSSSSTIQRFAPTNDAAYPCIKFSQRAWLEQHISTAVEHQLAQVLQSIMPALQDLPQDPALALTSIVNQGYAAVDELQCSLTLASRTFAQQELSLDALGLRLLWNLNRTAYEMMQFTRGVKVKLLAPQANWQSGVLRFVVHLVLQTPVQGWRWDLAQRTAGSSFVAPPAEAIVQADQAWCLEPVLLSDLEIQIWQAIEQSAPEIAMLRTETEAIVTTSHTGELGTVKLLAAFEFTPVQEQKGSTVHG